MTSATLSYTFVCFLFFFGLAVRCSGLSPPGSFRLFVSCCAASASSFTRTNRLTKKPFVASSPGEQRTRESASALQRTSGLCKKNQGLQLLTWIVHLIRKPTPMPARQHLVPPHQPEASGCRFFCLQCLPDDVFVLYGMHATRGVNDPLHRRDCQYISFSPAWNT